ncbi:hypothetical protein SDJN02_15670, partial [Cucurbita argyrosperma subsp. argyrosperma]
MINSQSPVPSIGPLDLAILLKPKDDGRVHFSFNVDWRFLIDMNLEATSIAQELQQQVRSLLS